MNKTVTDIEENKIICPKCFLIPEIDIFVGKDKTYVSYKCPNNHSGHSIPLSFFLKESFSTSKNLRKCYYCDNNSFVFCLACKKAICNDNKCIENHLINGNCNNSDIIAIQDINNICLILKEKVLNYCKTCKINFCKSCQQHSNHETFTLSEKITDQDIILFLKKLMMQKNN